MARSKRFYIGDRVSVYGYARGSSATCYGAWATVKGYHYDELIVNLDCDPDTTTADYVHPKQCVRLVKKKKNKASKECGAV